MSDTVRTRIPKSGPRKLATWMMTGVLLSLPLGAYIGSAFLTVLFDNSVAFRSPFILLVWSAFK